MYHFPDLTEAQKLERRHRLDSYSSFAQLSVSIPLALIPFFFAASWLLRRRRRKGGAGRVLAEALRSPYRKGRFELGAAVRKWVWWWGGDVVVLGGTRGEGLGALVWMGWLVGLCFWGTGEDYLHLTKRFGIIAASQLPFHYLLALKSPYSPLQLLTRASHETLNTAHQLIGRIITALLYLHAAFYLNFYVQSGLLAGKAREAYVICGIVGILAFTAVGTTALAPVRRWSYRVFYVTHVVLATALLPLLWFHVAHVRIYLYEAAGVYVVNVLLRALDSSTLAASIRLVPESSLVVVSIPLTDSARRSRWLPGQHAYLSLAGHPLSRTFRSNPFTCASVPSIDGQLRFVARILDGNTAKLAQGTANDNSSMLTVEGPYGVQTHADRLLQYDRVLFVAGGVGGTFVVPLYRQLLADLSPGKSSYRRSKVNFLWVAKSTADVSWAMPMDRGEMEGFVERMNVCLTSAGEDVSAMSNGSFLVSNEDEDEDKVAYAETEEGIELQEQKQLLSDESNGLAGKGGAALSTHVGRPNLRRVVDSTFAHGSAERVAVIVCGPKSLSRDVRKEIGRWVEKGREVWFWDERFAL